MFFTVILTTSKADADILHSYELNTNAYLKKPVTLEAFEKDLKRNLYKIWNRMSSGSYFPPPVAAVEIPKPHGDGVRVLGVPTVADRIAQTVVAGRLEGKVEPIFHPDSYGYRPGRSALGGRPAPGRAGCVPHPVHAVRVRRSARRRGARSDRPGPDGP